MSGAANPDSPEMARAMLTFVGHGSPEPVISALVEFEAWIRQEAIEAGGIGPNEAGRLWGRHLADSLSFLHVLDGCRAVIDIGSGIGLPGIPLALALPDVDFTLLDRAERRCGLARRAVRILDLANVEVVQGDASAVVTDHDVAVSRATIPPAELLPIVRHMMPNGRLAVTAASQSARPEAVDGWELVEIPAHLIGHRSWLMKASLSAPRAS